MQGEGRKHDDKERKVGGERSRRENRNSILPFSLFLVSSQDRQRPWINLNIKVRTFILAKCQV